MSSFTPTSATRNISTSSRRSPVSESTASGRRERWKQYIFPCTRYDGLPSGETSFVVCGIDSASSSRSAIVAIAKTLFDELARERRREARDHARLFEPRRERLRLGLDACSCVGTDVLEQSEHDL